MLEDTVNTTNPDEEILKIEGLRKYFPVKTRLIGGRLKGWLKAVDGISFTIKSGQTFGLVGESGCGKTTTSRLILRVIVAGPCGLPR